MSSFATAFPLTVMVLPVASCAAFVVDVQASRTVFGMTVSSLVGGVKFLV